jgi:acetyl-CoA acetyltransferase
MRLSAKYFTDNELKCKGSGILKLDPTFDAELTELRKIFAQPMRVNSCCRSAEHNAKVGGAKMSFHIADKPAWRRLTGCAAIDVAYSTKEYRDTLARLAWHKGWRVGYNKTFLHLDIAAIKKIKPKSVFKYDNVSDAEFNEFKQIIKG